MRRVLALAAVAGAACDGGVVEPEPPFELAGTYLGAVQGTTDIATLDATLRLTVEQQGGSLSGAYGLTGRLVYLGAVADVEGTGSFTGTVGAGDRPAIDILVRTPLCADYEAAFVGRFDPTTGRLWLGGAVDIFEGGCTVLVRFDIVMSLIQ